MRTRVAVPFLTTIALLLSGVVGTASPQNEPTDLILEGQVWTGDADQPWAEAVAVEDKPEGGWGPAERSDRETALRA